MATIRKRNGRWQVQIRRVGSSPRTRTFSEKTDAIAWARLQESQIELGYDGIARRQVETHTIANALDRYAEEVIPGKRSDSGEAYMIAVIKRHRVGSVLVRELAARDLACFRDDRLRDCKPATVLRQLRVLLHALKVANDEWGWQVPLSELRKVRLPKVLVKPIDRVTDDDLQLFLNHAAGVSSGELSFAVRLALATGMRRGELLALSWTDVDLKARTALIRMSKNGHPRKIPLAAAAMELLLTREHRVGPLFQLSANGLKLAFSRVRRRAGTSFRFHDLRHEAVSRFFEMGLTVPEVQLISGHRTMSQLSRYAHPDVARVAHKLC